MISSLISFLFGDIYGLLLTAVAAAVSLYVYRCWTTRLPPAPFPVLPILGNYFHMEDGKKMMFYQQLAKLKERYGSVFTWYLGPTPFVILNDYEAVKEALLTQPTTFAGRAYSYSGDVFSEGSNDIAMADFGPQWTIHRRLAMVALKKFADKGTVSHLVCESTTDVCEMMLRECEEEGKVKDMQKKMYLLIYNVIAAIVFGKKFKEDDKDFGMMVSNITEVNEITMKGLLADFWPILRFIPTPSQRRFKKALANVLSFFTQQIEEHKASLDESHPRDITDAVLIARAEMEREGKEDISFFQDVHTRQTISDVFLAGTDTTCFTLLWTVLHCLHYPEEQEKVYREIEAHVGTRMVVPEDRRQLVYTEAFLQEVMRMRPIAPFSIPHTPTTDTAELYGYHIEKSINVLPNIWACHHDAKYWPNPERFDPTRFIEEGKVLTKPDSFLPFSLGRRACAGENLARADTFLIFATLVQKVKLSALADEPLVSLEPDVAAGVFACNPQPFQMKIERR